MIQITDSAKEYLNQTESEVNDRTSISFQDICSGFQYKWEMTDTTENHNDNILVVDKITEMFGVRMHHRLCKRVWWKLSQSN